MRAKGVLIGLLGCGLAFAATAQTPAKKPATPAPKASAKAPRTAADQRPQPYPLNNFYKPPPTPTEVGRTVRPTAYRYAPCLDAKVAPLVGLSREDALQKVRGMNLMQFRVLALESPVNYERVPERLTLIVTAAGKVQRAFCR